MTSSQHDRPTIGGQAVIEGVMMRGPTDMAIALRTPDGGIMTQRQDIKCWTARKRWNRIPFLRGIAAMYEALVLGMGALMYSAEHTASEDEQIGRGGMILSMVLAVVLAIGLFMVLPTVAGGFVRRLAPVETPLVLNLIEGLIRLSILIGYVWSVSRVQDVGRVLEYHGAEHKVIKAFEEGSLDSDVIKRQSTLHVRCGTSFLLLVVVISVLLFALFGWPGVLVRTVLRLALLPVIAALSYEVVRLASNSKLSVMRIVTWPGMMLQRLTTREPDDDQIEVALSALNALLEDSEPLASEVSAGVGSTETGGATV